MDKTQAFQAILQMRNSFVGTKQEHVIVDQAINTLNLELFPKPEVKPKEVKKSKSK